MRIEGGKITVRRSEHNVVHGERFLGFFLGFSERIFQRGILVFVQIGFYECENSIKVLFAKTGTLPFG